MIDKLVFTYHAANRWFERFPNLDFKTACKFTKPASETIKYKGRGKKTSKKRGGVLHKSACGPIFVVRDGFVVTVY
ncbi:MAG: hypothetical protein VYC55_07845 [Pseudomonadota bacterium]|nr:hypothetical protein [Pseudomonadota bacterium]